MTGASAAILDHEVTLRIEVTYQDSDPRGHPISHGLLPSYMRKKYISIFFKLLLFCVFCHVQWSQILYDAPTVLGFF